VLREVVVSGRTDDPAVFAALADLRSWIDEQFAMSIAHLRIISGEYDLDLDSRIAWSINAVGFEPLTVRFELQRSQVLGLLSKELYEDDPLAFVRELLQNSVDAIDMRAALLENHGATLNGEIKIRICSTSSGLCIDWTDNGIGMDVEVLTSYFAKLGLSWYRSREARRLGYIEAISQFGVGVLSCFAVSQKLIVQTRRDPQAGGSPPGLSVEIPKRESHFRIRTTTSLPVGTKIGLEVTRPLAMVVSGEAVREALIRTARYVRHKIIVDFNGVTSEIGSLARRGDRDADDGDDDLKIAVLGMVGDSAERLSAATTAVTFDLGSPAGDYHGHYSAVVPKIPNEARRDVENSVWFLEGKRVELDDVSIDTGQALFVKGIQAGPVTKGRLRKASYFGVARHNSWIAPKLLVNVRRPSELEFNLARSSVHVKSRDWLNGMWGDIALRLCAKTFSWPLASAADTAILLGSCAVFGGVPDVGLDALVETNESPVLVLSSAEGPTWRVLNEFVQGEEFIEAPFEIAYARSGEFSGFGRKSGLKGWEGNDALFPSEGLASKRYPWLNAVLAFGHRALTQLGWCPVEIRIVRPTGAETVPLVCRVWKKSGGGDPDDDRSAGTPDVGRRRVASWHLMKNLYREAPEVLRFPASIAKYAAMGSRYWNINHPKIVRIIAVLTELQERRRQERLSADKLRKVSYLTSNSYYGYLVPSRKSGITLALEVPNRLLALAKEEGLAPADDLVPADFFPGTIDGYENPYHYDLSGWKTTGTGLGRRLD